MPSLLLVVFAAILVAARPWRSDDEEWFQASALLAAILATAFLFTIVL
jgi:hypothetical protein